MTASPTVFQQSGNNIFFQTEPPKTTIDKIPGGTYVVLFSPGIGFYLEEITPFRFSGKRYGHNVEHTERIYSTFLSRNVGTGVMLCGEKGSGKSLLAKTLSMRAAQDGIPTLVINTPFHGDGFNKLIQSIRQPCVVMFDEFEKVYSSEAQEALLTLLDGAFPSQKMFVFTCNGYDRVDSHMKNRPGRVYYMIKFEGLEEKFVREYCEDNLNNKSYINSVVDMCAVMGKVNFDMLKALVEEMNRYDESPKDAVKWLNVTPAFNGRSSYDVTMFVDGKKVESDMLISDSVNILPMAGDGFGVSWKVKHTEEEIAAMSKEAVEALDSGCSYHDTYLPGKALVSFKEGVYTYEGEYDGMSIKVLLTKKAASDRFSYIDYF